MVTRKTHPGKFVDTSIFPPQYIISIVNTKENRTGTHPVQLYTITNTALQYYIMVNKVEIHLVTELYINEIFMSGSFLPLLELCT